MRIRKICGFVGAMTTCLLLGLVSCTTQQTPPPAQETVTDTPTEQAPTPTEPITTPQQTEPATETPTEPPVEETEPEPETVDYSLHISASRLDATMTPLFTGHEVANETVMFLDYGQTKTLLYKVDTILSVTSYDGTIVYVEGKDYELRDGQLYLPEGSAIPCITSERYYNAPGSIIQTMHDGKAVPTYWGEGRLMTDWQVCVNYTHSDDWTGYAIPTAIDQYQGLINKLKAGEDVTIFFYGDSITVGANSSFFTGYAPYQQSFPLLLVKALADLFDYRVTYIDTRAALSNSGPMGGVPSTDYVPVENYKGTITYVNTAVGGWDSVTAFNNYNKHVGDYLSQYGCDLFVYGYGMNDAANAPRAVSANAKKVLNKVAEAAPGVQLMIISTMVPNPDGIGWYGNQPKQEPELIKLAADYVTRGIPCAVAPVTSVSLSVLEHKDFMDYTGNNINHPNDFFTRVYLQTLFQTLIGYENLDA